jgi:CoA:oxalate CoA-transferase
VAEQEHAAARQMIADVGIGSVRSAGIPVKLARTPGAIRRPPPAVGEDNEPVLGRLSAGADSGAGLRPGA